MALPSASSRRSFRLQRDDSAASSLTGTGSNMFLGRSGRSSSSSSAAPNAAATPSSPGDGASTSAAADEAAPFPTVSRVDPAAAEQEAAIARLSGEGEWEKALEMLQSIRDEGMKPSMAAHMDVIGVCRRALEWDQATKTYRDMIQAHLPACPFREMACEDFEDESEHAFARACGLVLRMGAERIRPNNGTFRALLQFCKDDGSWQAAILLLEHARRAKVKVKFNLFSFDLLIATVAEQGYPEVSTMLYELGVVDADLALLETDETSTSTRAGGGLQVDIPWPMWPLKVGAKGTAILELHDLTLSIALATVKVALLDVVRRPKGRAHWKRGDKRLRIITGMGNNSKDNEAVIKPAVAELLESEGLKPEFQQHNEGCIELKPVNLEAYVKRMTSQGAARREAG